jgi:uncharacterized membrane protein (UPF0127 family)
MVGGRTRPTRGIHAMNAIVRNLTRNTVIASRATVAESVLTRARGLIGRRALTRGEGLVLDPCSGIHTFFMRMPLDVVFVNRHNQVVCSVSGLPAWAMLPWVRAATRVIEVPVGTVHESRTAVGDLLSIEADGTAVASGTARVSSEAA